MDERTKIRLGQLTALWFVAGIVYFLTRKS